MLLIAVKVIHGLLGLGAVAAGISFARRMVTGRPFGNRAVQFLEFSLAASVFGIFFSLHHAGPTRWAAALGVYVSALAVFSWRKFQADDKWAPAFVLSALGVLCVDAVVVFAHLFKLAPWLHTLAPSRRIDLYFLSVSLAALLFLGLSIFAVIKFHGEANNSEGHKVTG